jgi:phospholipid/cholesterol/gamma-HCH transport system substrate-binding protein
VAQDRLEVLAGALVLAVGIGFAVYAARNNGLSGNDGSYVLTASFRSVDGISVGSDVRLAGVAVGKITSLRLNPETYFADAVVSIDKSVILPDDSAILISSEGLLGGNFIELVPGGSPINLEPGEEIEDTQGSISLVSLLMKFVTGSSDATSAAP